MNNYRISTCHTMRSSNRPVVLYLTLQCIVQSFQVKWSKSRKQCKFQFKLLSQSWATKLILKLISWVFYVQLGNWLSGHHLSLDKISYDRNVYQVLNSFLFNKSTPNCPHSYNWLRYPVPTISRNLIPP